MNSKLLGQVSLGRFPFRPLISYLLDLNQRKFCGVAFISHRASALLGHVAHILDVGSKPEMVGSNARRIIAMVKNPQAVWNRSEVENPTCDVSIYGLATMTSREGSISGSSVMESSGPKPAPFSFLDLGPKASLESWGKALRGKIFSGNLDHSSVLPRIGYWPTEALSL
jgi:hypothetical protein